MREAFFDDPEGLILSAISEQGANLRRMWQDAVEEHPYPMVASLSEEIRVESSEFSDRRIVWITAPMPERPTEAFSIALLGGEAGSGVDCHYLVLELSEDSEGIFCEWTEAGDHRNYGPLPGTTMPVFQDAVRSGLSPARSPGEA